MRRPTGSIPACAGQPGDGHDDLSPAQVYPRVCGAAHYGRHRPAVGQGLSPRVRGSHGPRFEQAAPVGLSPRVRGSRPDVPSDAMAGGSIPACAGQPHQTFDTLLGTKVYPRVCGAADPHVSGTVAGTGLSPRVRGSRLTAVALPVGDGSIPACAGQPPRQVNPRRVHEVYPRVCGAAELERRKLVVEGLSPRVRGSHAAFRFGYGSPRAQPPSVWYRAIAGLSPRVRGSLPLPSTRHPRGQRGSIPACAGQPNE